MESPNNNAFYDNRPTLDDLIVAPPEKKLATHTEPFQPPVGTFIVDTEPPVPVEPEPVLGEPQLETILSPYRVDTGVEDFVTTIPEWNMMVKLSAKGGFGGADQTGLTRDSVNIFKRSLSAALDRGFVAADYVERVESLIRYCDEDGKYGFFIAERFKRALPRRGK